MDIGNNRGMKLLDIVGGENLVVESYKNTDFCMIFCGGSQMIDGIFICQICLLVENLNQYIF